MPVTGKESPMPRGAKDTKPAKAKIEAELASLLPSPDDLDAPAVLLLVAHVLPRYSG